MLGPVLGVLGALASNPHPGPPSLDLAVETARARAAAVRARFAQRSIRAYGPGPRVVSTPRFLWVEDGGRTLPGPPWTTHDAYAEAFELARTAWSTREPDRARILLVFTTFEEGGRALFYLPLANDVRGLGEGDEAALFDATPESALEGYAWMGAVSVLDEAGPTFATEAFLHEVAHRWSAYVRVDRAGVPRDILLGRHRTHWSFLLDTDLSPMEGNDWRPELDGGWRTHYQVPPSFAFSPLDLYLMGLLPPSEVPPMTAFLSYGGVRPDWFSARPEETPAHRLGLVVTLTSVERVEVTIDDVIRSAGPRDPPAASVFPVELPIGVVLVSDGRARPTPERLAAFDRRLAGWAEAFGATTGGRMTLALALESAGTRPLGSPCASPDDCDRRASDRCSAPHPDGPTVCTRACTGHEACGPGACCVGTLAPGLCVRADACGAPPVAGRDVGPAASPPDAGSPGPDQPSDPKATACACAGLRAPGRPPALLFAAPLALLGRSRGRRRRSNESGRPLGGVDPGRSRIVGARPVLERALPRGPRRLGAAAPAAARSGGSKERASAGSGPSLGRAGRGRGSQS